MRQRHQSISNPRLQLLIITQFYPPDYAATGQLIEELAHRLSQDHFDVRIFTGQPGYAFSEEFAPAKEQHPHLKIQRSHISRLWRNRIRGKAINGLLFCVRSGLHLLRAAFRNDVVLLTTAPPYLPVLGYIFNLLFGLPYICLVYDLYPDVAVQLGVVPPSHPIANLWQWLNRKIWKRAAQLIVLSPTIKSHIIEHYGVPAHKLSVIHSWADPTLIQPCPKEQNWFAQQHHLDRTFTVLYSGNMGRCHDLETILETAYHLRHEPIQFVFIGDGAKRLKCLKLVDEYRLTNCLFLPYQDKQDLPYSLTSCDLSLVSLSEGMEGLLAPSKFYGCLAAGRPIAVICEPRSYLKQLVQEAGCGAAFRQGDSIGLADFIRNLSADPHQVKRMGAAGRAYLETHFTPQTIAEQYAQVVWSAVQRRSPVRLPSLPPMQAPAESLD